MLWKMLKYCEVETQNSGILWTKYLMEMRSSVKPWTSLSPDREVIKKSMVKHSRQRAPRRLQFVTTYVGTWPIHCNKLDC